MIGTLLVHSVPIVNNSQKTVKTAKMTIGVPSKGVPIVTCLHRVRRIHKVTHGLFKEPIIGSLQSKMAEIRHFENRHDVIFFCRGWSDLDIISQTDTE